MKIPALRKTFKDLVALDLPQMEIPDGSITAVFGHNGSGKSTLSRILAGIILPDEKHAPLPGIKVGYMNQYAFPFRLSVAQNLLQNADPALSRAENKEHAHMLLKAIGLDQAAGKNACKLSGGQIQRMSLARVLMKPYDLLILDEPTASMDTSTIPLAEELIHAYHKRTNCTVIWITHSLEQAQRVADQILVLEDGHILQIQETTPEAISK